jgi:hypothetical protein
MMGITIFSYSDDIIFLVFFDVSSYSLWLEESLDDDC